MVALAVLTVLGFFEVLMLVVVAAGVVFTVDVVDIAIVVGGLGGVVFFLSRTETDTNKDIINQPKLGMISRVCKSYLGADY